MLLKVLARGALVVALVAPAALGQPTLGPQPGAAAVAPTGEITAQPAAPAQATTVVKLNLAEALAMGLAHDHDVRSQQYAAASARQGVTRAWSVYQPQVSLDSSASTFDSARTGITSGAGAAAKDRYTVGFHVDQLLFDLGTGLLDVYRSRELAKAAGFDSLATELTAAGTIVRDFYDLLRTQAMEKLQAELLAQSTRQRQQADALFEAGKGSRLDVRRATVAENNAQIDLDVAANATRTSAARVRKDLGLPPGQPLEATEATVVPPAEMELAKALALGEAVPGVRSAEANQRAQRFVLESAKIQRWATMRVTGSYDYYLANSQNTTSEYVLGASLSIPLWDGLSGKASAEQARLAWLRAGEQLLREREQVRLDIEQAHITSRDAIALLGSAERASALAAETLLQTEESYRAGAASLLDVGDARTAYQQAESNRITARLDRDVAAMNLRLAVGRLPLTDVALAATVPAAKESGR